MFLVGVILGLLSRAMGPMFLSIPLITWFVNGGQCGSDEVGGLPSAQPSEEGCGKPSSGTVALSMSTATQSCDIGQRLPLWLANTKGVYY